MANFSFSALVSYLMLKYLEILHKSHSDHSATAKTISCRVHLALKTTHVAPHAIMIMGSHIDGLHAFMTMFDGTSKMT